MITVSRLPGTARGLATVIGLSATAAALALCGPAAAQLAYDTHEIDVGEADSYQLLFGNLTGAETEDLVFFAEAGGVRRMAVYSLDGGTFSRVHLAEECCRSFGWVAVMYLGGEAVLLTQSVPDRIDRIDPATGAVEPWLTVPWPVERSSRNRPGEEAASASGPGALRRRFDVAQDLDGDGFDDVAWPVDGGVAVWRQRPGGSLAEPVRLATPVAPSYRDLAWFAYRLDHDGDGIEDLALPVRGGLAVHRGLGDGGWVGEAEVLAAGAEWPADTVPRHVLVSEARESGSDPDPSSRLFLGIEDFNADGIGDIVSMDGWGDFYWHFGRRKGKATHFREAPDTSILPDGGLQLPLQLYDLDGDGREEVCMVPSPKLSGILSGVFRRSVRLELHCYRMAEGGYPPAPSRRWRFRVPVDVPAPYTFGDLTGDGLLDAVVPASGTRLHVYPGTGDARLFADEPIAVDVDLPGTDESIRFRDLNGDGKADMYVNRGGAEGSPLRTWVALSR